MGHIEHTAHMSHTAHTYIVYKHTVPSGKVYIGITRQKPQTRWNNGKRYINNRYFSAAIQKYGWENIMHDILFTGMTKEQAEIKEIELIALYNSADRLYGYNIECGGKTTGTIAEETKELLRAASAGKLHTEETKRKVSAARLGVPKSEKTRQRMKVAKLKQSEETRARISETRKGKGQRPILQYGLDGSFIKAWNGVREAAMAINADGGNIIKCCNSKYKTVSGYRWKYGTEGDILQTKVICVTNQKGGVGKSTSAEALAEGLTIKGKSTLLIDLDPQGSITLTAGADPNRPTAYEVFTKQAGAVEAIQQRAGRADIIPASKSLARLDVELTATGKEYRLKEQLKPLLSRYDFIIIDTPPALGVITVNALTAANSIIIPAQADIYSLQGIGQLCETIDAIRAYTNPSLTLAGVLLTRHNSRSVLSRDMADAARSTAEQIGTFLYNTVIREAVAVKESQASQQPIYEYAPKSNAAADYMTFTEEFLERSGNHA